MTEKDQQIRRFFSGEQEFEFFQLGLAGFEYNIKRRVIDEISKMTPNDIYIIHCGKEVCQPNKEPIKDVRKFFGLHYVIAGEGYLEFSGKKVKVSSGTAFAFCPSDEIVGYYPDSKRPWTYIYLELSGLLSDTIMRDLGFQNKYHLFAVQCNQRIASAFFKLHEAFCETGGKSYRTYAALYTLFAEFKELHPSKKAKNETLKEKYVRQVFEYVRNNFGNVTAESIAQNCSVSTAYLTSVCKEITGLSLKQCITVYNLSVARNFLRMTNEPIAAIAKRYGCSETKYFSKVFKKYFGVSPMEYRKREQSLKVPTKIITYPNLK